MQKDEVQGWKKKRKKYADRVPIIALWIICGAQWGKEHCGYSRRKKNREHLNHGHTPPYSKCEVTV